MSPEQAQKWRQEIRLARLVGTTGYVLLVLGISLMYGFYACCIVLFASGFLILAMATHGLLYEERTKAKVWQQGYDEAIRKVAEG